MLAFKKYMCTLEGRVGVRALYSSEALLGQDVAYAALLQSPGLISQVEQ